jgi:parallel beta-helix repeat protein
MKAIYIVSIIALIGAMIVTPATATTWYVHDGESIYNYTGYSGAHWGEVSPGDTIFVYNGSYGVFYIDKPNLKVIGEGVDVVTADFGDTHNIRMPDSVGNATGSVLEGITVVNSESGVKVGIFGPASNCIIRDCVFDGLTADLAIEGSNNIFMNNVVSNLSGACGICVHGTNITFRDNVVLNATGVYGAIDVGGEYNIIVDNTIEGSTGLGISLDYDNGNNIITRNNIISNGDCGIEMYGAGESNKIYLNNIVDNGVSVAYYDPLPAVTYWNSTEPIKYTYGATTYTNYLGNYWSDYGGVDTSPEDGIGDTPYGIAGIDSDFRPLMAGFENYPAPEADPLEFGDAPDPTHPSLLASNGARHTPTDTECLGLALNGSDWKDFEPDANVPDLDFFDDGLLTTVLTAGNLTQTVSFEVTNMIAQNDLLVNILLDLNQNGIWDSGEHVVQNQPINLIGPADDTFTSTTFSTVGHSSAVRPRTGWWNCKHQTSPRQHSQPPPSSPTRRTPSQQPSPTPAPLVQARSMSR